MLSATLLVVVTLATSNVVNWLGYNQLDLFIAALHSERYNY